MSITAASLVDRVIAPELTLRQWVLVGKGQEQLFAAVVADGACEAMGVQTAREAP
jgi:hypothetical protein